MSRALVPLGVAALVAALGGPAAPGFARAAPSPTPGLRDRFGLDVATRLLRSTDADDRLRGVERAAASHTPEALAVLLRAAASTASGGLDPRLPMEGIARTDPRALLEVVRGLAAWTDREAARSALAAIVAAPSVSFAVRPATRASADPVDDDAAGAARIALARREAALALADSGSSLALDALVAMARAGGPGQSAALDALALKPPSNPVALGGVVLTTPAMITLASEIGDLRTLDGILSAVRSSDPALRAAAILGLGASGDARAIDAARAGAADPDPRVRVAAASALVRLGAAGAGATIEGLVADDTTAIDGLRLAESLQDEGVTRALAARAAATADPALRAAAIRALGRQTSPNAVHALAALVADPRAGGDAAYAIARSPSAAAPAAIEAMATTGEARRLSARAYFVRRFTRGERSRRMDALVVELRASQDALDRALGTQIAVAFGEEPMAAALADPDARVRRAAAGSALAVWNDAAARRELLSHLATERDETTRIALALGLAGGDARAEIPLSTLVERVRGGAPDAPLAALALARRSDETTATTLDDLVTSRDAVVRAHALLGLGRSGAPDALGRLVAAYAWEPDVDVRRAIVAGVAAHADAAATRHTLELAASLDPDAVVRWTAARALARGPTASHFGPSATEVAWIRLAPAPAAPALRDETAVVLLAGGLAVPVAFDDDGYALVPGVDPGEARVRLAPRLPPYSASAP
jgi:HEAT repeat protein